MVLTGGVRTALWVTPVSNLAGVARHVLDVVGEGIPGWRVVVLTPPGPLADEASKVGGAVLTEPFGPDAGLKSSISSLRRAVRHLQPDIVHTHLAYADVAAALATMGQPVRLVSTEHGIAADDAVYHRTKAKSRVMAGVHHQRQRRLDGLIAVSHATLRTVRDKWQPPSSVIARVVPNGIDRADSPVREPGLHVGTICRLAPEKALDVAIEAFAIVVKDHPEAHLTIAGEGDMAKGLAAQADAAGIGDNVDFPGFVDADKALADFDVVVQLSVWENSSYALLDAMRAGCGVVATDVGGNPEMLRANHLVNQGDAEAVARAIVRQGMHPEERPTLPEHWPTVADMCAQIADVYAQVMA